MTIRLWSEGFVASGQSDGATFHGKYECSTLKEAIQMFKNSLTDQYSIDCVNVERESFWGCRFFDNEQDARKSFG